MIVKWLRKKAALTLTDERPGDSKEVGELRDECRLLNVVVDEQRAVIKKLLDRTAQHPNTENKAEETVEALRADLEHEKAQGEKWKRWGEKAVEKIMAHERLMDEKDKKAWERSRGS